MSISDCPTCWETPCICNNEEMLHLRNQQLKQHIEHMSKETKMNPIPKRRGRPPKVRFAEGSLPHKMDQAVMALADEWDKQKPILEEAHETIYGDREQTYGDPGKNLRTIASFWSTYLDCNVSYDDVCNMMVLMKVARLMNTPGHHDSLVDIAGYTALQDRVKRGR